ncbi:MAG: NAD(P)/FAD-dependent oxidoreductase [Candidatus Heimdallarchaeota archaeon]|nr:MAG: NAD(P)/FAD-dependent oxidoreductase [Candidatus Heimdallarchaeota archaeon]
MKEIENYDVIIIGAGMGGLHAGIYLQNKNPALRTLIVERNNYPGGYVSGFTNNGFYFDSAAEAILDIQNNDANKALREFGFNHTFHKLDLNQVYYINNKQFNMYSDLDKFLAEISIHHPDQAEGVKSLFETCHQITKDVEECRLENEKITLGKILKVIFKYPTLRKYARKSFRELLDDFITDERLFEYFSLFCLWFGLKYEELDASVAAHILNYAFTKGMHYPEGGMGSFALNLVKHYKARGGTMKYGATVRKIIVKKNVVKGVELEDRTIISSKYVVSNGDLRKTVFDYVGKEHFRKKYLTRIQRLRQSISGYMMFVGLENIDLSEYPPHFIIGKGSEIVPKVRDENINLDSIGVRISANIDPGLRKGSKESLIVLGFATNKWNNYWKTGKTMKRSTDYRKLKKEIMQKLITTVEKIIPNLSKHIVLMKLATPLTFESFNQSTDGSWYGPEFNQKLPSFKSPIKNLFFAGSNVKGGGVTPAMSSGLETGKYLLKKIERDYLKKSFYPVISKETIAANKDLLNILLQESLDGKKRK